MLDSQQSGSNNDAMDLENDPSRLIELGDKESQEKEWGLAGGHYIKAIELLEKKLSQAEAQHKYRESLKQDLLTCQLKLFRARLEVRSQPTAMTASMTLHGAHDISREIRELIKKTEQSIRNYEVHNQALVWNELEIEYDRRERDSLAEGRDYEAGEFNCAMMRARRSRAWASRNVLEYVKLTAADLLFGFGHRMGRVLVWIAVIILGFSVIYWLFYDGLGLSGQMSSQVNIVAPQGTYEWPWLFRQAIFIFLRCLSSFLTLGLRYIHSLFISSAILFLPGRLSLQPTHHFLKLIVDFNEFLTYVVNVGLIALVVNKLASRRKW
jgi:hypothetical protein